MEHWDRVLPGKVGARIANRRRRCRGGACTGWPLPCCSGLGLANYSTMQLLFNRICHQ